MSEAKSFYIFDFDDNLIHTGSLTYVYHKKTGEEVSMTSSEFIQQRAHFGKSGPYKDYEIDPAPHKTYRNFHDDPDIDHFPFVDDLKEATSKSGWEGPSWQRFLKAVDRDRTIAIITARGNDPEQIREGFKFLADQGHIPKQPQIHSVYAMTHQSTKDLIRWTGPDEIAAMKKQALHHFIEKVYEDFGHKAEHRFGFSDDDPKNIESTRAKFQDLKLRNPHHGFFLFEARPNQVIEEEITL
ncbi:MAG: hypothetical protein HRT44_04330 [Bdellovibrionales bacterium]|nr:hypothetical protein [Bdellovibrionales bacterium]NQZ18471.1 hypothetical protein [Bdellovibrionales bacterium]